MSKLFRTCRKIWYRWRMMDRMKDSRFAKWKQAGRAVIDRAKEKAEETARDARGIRLTSPIKSVGLKLFLTFFFSIVFFVLIVGFLSYNTSKNIIKDKVAVSAEETIQQTGGKLDLMLSRYADQSLQIILDSDLLTDLKDLNDGVGDDYTKLEKQRKSIQFLNNFIFTDSTIQSVHLFLTNGQLLTTGSMISVDNVESADWHQAAMEQDGAVVWLPTRTSGFYSNAKTFGLTRKLSDPITSRAVGVVLIEIKYDALKEQLEDINVGEGYHTFIVDPSGTVVYADDEELLEQPLNLALPDASRGKLEALDHEGEDALISYVRSPVTEWTLVGTVPVGELVADARRILVVTLVIALIATIMAMGIGFVLARMIGRPLSQLSSLMKEGEGGNLKVRASINRRDEIGQLGQSFNQMMEKITQLVQQTNNSARQVLENSAWLLEASKNTAVSAKEISVATEEIAEGASTLAVEAERGNELTNHIGVQMRAVIDANIGMGHSAADVRKVSDQGIAYMGELITKTNATEEMTRSMVEKVDRLKESTSSIRNILDMLNNIAKQTNILSLNATIEAARAGNAGKGFMVVADEIRKLADQSRQSIDVVGQITETIQAEIDETVQVMSEAYPLFQEQIDSVKEVDQIFKNVQTNMESFIQQLDSVTESIQQLEQSQITLSEAMSSVSAVSQQSSATSEEVASLSNEQLSVSEGLVSLAERLEALSNDLRESLSRFTV